LVLRIVRGIDIRKSGTGNVGSTNLMVHIGFWPGLVVGVYDCLVKGTLPVALAWAFGLPEWARASMGVAAIAGHNWSPFLLFTGGRGVATMIGGILGFVGWREAIILILVGGVWGRMITKQFALWLSIGIALLAPVAFLTGAPRDLAWFDLGALLVLALKRLTANWERPWPGEPLWSVFWHRLVYDRDIADHKKWINRGVDKPWNPGTQ
jgi:glycerol-3-phosphate acyltransferase PlsY